MNLTYPAELLQKPQHNHNQRNNTMIEKNSINDDISVEDALIEKLSDAESTPGLEVEFDPDEAEKAGAFEEDAISEDDALDSSADLIDIG
jgi:hypothetical protein